MYWNHLLECRDELHFNSGINTFNNFCTANFSNVRIIHVLTSSFLPALLLLRGQARGSCASFVFGFVTFMSIGGFPSFVEDMKASLLIILHINTPKTFA